MRIIYRFFLFILPVLSWAVDIAEDNRQILHINFLGGAPKSLHPHLCRDFYSSVLFKSLYEGLTRINLNEKVELALARKIEISKCKTKYTIYLRPSKWENGKKVTANHFIDAWKSAVKPNTRCVQPYHFFIIKNAKKIFKGKLPLDEIGLYAPSEDKIIIHLEHPAPYFTQLLADIIYSPLFTVSDVNKHVFNGPFTIDVFHESEGIALKKNPLYWDSRTVKLEGVNISLARDSATAYDLYKKGKLDFIGSPFSELTQETMHNSKNIKEKKVCAPHWLHMNTSHPKLRSKNIRRALSLAIDREYIAKYILLNASPDALTITKELSSLPVLKTDEDIQRLFAKGLLEIDCKLEDYVITLNYTFFIRNASLAEYLKYQWEKIFKIQVVLEKSDWNTYLAKLSSGDFCIGGLTKYASYEDPSYFLEYFYDEKNNYSKWENEKFQKWIDLANQATSEKLRKKYLAKAEEILEDACPVIPLYTHKHLYFCNPALKKFFTSRWAYTDFKWAYFQKE